jgi:hypothetical protein
VYIAWHAGDGTGEQNRRVWVVRSSDEGRTFQSEAPADGQQRGVCGCCGMKAFADREGTVYLLYRTAEDKSKRDMVLLTSTDGGKSYAPGLTDPWTIATCPMSNEAFADGPDAVTLAWESSEQVLFAKVDKKRHLTSRPIAAPGSPNGRKHPALALNGRGETILVWDEGTGWERGGALAWQVFDDKGKPTASKGRIDKAIPVWGLAAVYAEPDDSFTIVY